MDVKLFLQLYGIDKRSAARSLHLSKSNFNRRLRTKSFTKSEIEKLFGFLNQGVI